MPAAKLKISILIKCTSSKARFFFFEPRAYVYSRVRFVRGAVVKRRGNGGGKKSRESRNLSVGYLCQQRNIVK